jgi:hypothetical protein
MCAAGTAAGAFLATTSNLAEDRTHQNQSSMPVKRETSTGLTKVLDRLYPQGESQVPGLGASDALGPVEVGALAPRVAQADCRVTSVPKLAEYHISRRRAQVTRRRRTRDSQSKSPLLGGFKHQAEARMAVFDRIGSWYNPYRLRSAD